MPKKGWLNDPNGLVYFKGEYHIFYQADEENLLGHVNKAWGHYSTKDFITYKRHELATLPDSIYDKNGAYSGSAIVKDDVLYLFIRAMLNMKEIMIILRQVENII